MWGNTPRPVAAAHVFQNLVAALLAEIDVEVGHGDALGVEEALKDERPQRSGSRIR